MKLAICDDEEYQRKLIAAFAKEYLQERGIAPCKMYLYSSAVEMAESMEKENSFDICLLDICMPNISGIELAREIRKTNRNAEIIFLTTSGDYAIEAFAVKATHYLLKPYHKEDFYAAMDRAYQNFTRTAGKSILLKAQGGGVFSVETDEILYIEANHHTLTLYCKNEVREILGTLAQLLEELKQLTTPKQFAAPFKGYIVNQKNIKEITPQAIVLVNDRRIAMARGKFKAVKDCYFEFVFEGKSL